MANHSTLNKADREWLKALSDPKLYKAWVAYLKENKIKNFLAR